MDPSLLAALAFLAIKTRDDTPEPSPVVVKQRTTIPFFAFGLNAAVVTDRYLSPYANVTPANPDPYWTTLSRDVKLADWNVSVAEAPNGSGGTANVVVETFLPGFLSPKQVAVFALTPVPALGNTVLKPWNGVGSSVVIPKGTLLQVRYDVAIPAMIDWDLIVTLALDDA